MLYSRFQKESCKFKDLAPLGVQGAGYYCQR